MKIATYRVDDSGNHCYDCPICGNHIVMPKDMKGIEGTPCGECQPENKHNKHIIYSHHILKYMSEETKMMAYYIQEETPLSLAAKRYADENA